MVFFIDLSIDWLVKSALVVETGPHLVFEEFSVCRGESDDDDEEEDFGPSCQFLLLGCFFPFLSRFMIEFTLNAT